MTKVVAIVVNYNAGDWLYRSINALLQSSCELDVYVVDNASVDQSMVSLEPLNEIYQNLHLIYNEENIGFAKANNQILSKELADYYLLVNPDCIVQLDSIEKLIACIKSDPQVALAGTLILNQDGTIQKTCRRRFPTPASAFKRIIGLTHKFASKQKQVDFDYGGDDKYDQNQYVEAVSGAFMLVDAHALSEVGGLDESYFMHCEDLDWCKRFWLKGYKVAYYPVTQVLHGKGRSSLSNPYKVNWHLHLGMLRFYQKFYYKQYSLPVTIVVYLGVLVRFLAKSVGIFVSQVIKKTNNPNNPPGY